MERIHSEVKKKNEEIEFYRKELQDRSPRSEPPAHRRTSLMPADLDDEGKGKKQEEMASFRRRRLNDINETD